MWLAKALTKSNTIIIESSQTDTLNNDPCSCTSFSSSDIDDRVITELLAEQSRLYNALSAKYSLPLKEEQLLEKFFKTRPLYDVLKSNLLSSSTSDSSKIVTDKKLRSAPVRHPKAAQKTEKNNLCTVNDKRAVSGAKELNESCSCCLCCLKTRLQECVQKGRRNRQAHINEKIAVRSNLASKQTNAETKNIKSDPCTCACKHKNNKECQRENHRNFHIKQPDIGQRDRFLLPNRSKPLSPNSKHKISYHKLKRCYFTPYMENIGEGGIRKAQKFTKLSRNNADKLPTKDLESKEKLKLLQKKIKDSFLSELDALPKLSPEKRRIFQNTLNESNKNAFIDSVITQFLDKSYFGHTQKLETVQKCELKPRRYKRNDNIHSPNTATTSIKKTKNVTDLLRSARKQQKYPTSKRVKNNQPLVNMLQISNQLPKPNENNISLFGISRYSKSLPSLLSTNSIPIKDDYFPFIKNEGKGSSTLIKSHTSGILLKILKSVSTSSIEKNSWLGNMNSTNKSPPTSSYNVNKVTVKINPLTSLHKMIIGLSTPMQSNTTRLVVQKNLSPNVAKTTLDIPKLDKQRLNEELIDQQIIPPSQIIAESNTLQALRNYKEENCPETASLKKTPISTKLKTNPQQQSEIKYNKKHNKSSSHALKKCVCNLRIKVIDTKSKISKSSAKQNKAKVKKSSKSKVPNPLKEWMKMSGLNIRYTKQIKKHAPKSVHSNSFKSLNIRRKRRRKRNLPYRHHFRKWSDFKLKYDLTCKKQTEQEVLVQSIPHITLKPVLTQDLVPVSCNPNEKTEEDKELVESDINKEKIEIQSECKSNLDLCDSDKTKNANMCRDSSTRLKTISTLKDASIGRDEVEIPQNQSVQTVNAIQNCGVLPFLPEQTKVLCEDRSTSDHGPIEVGTMQSKQGKSKSNTNKPIFNMIFFNKGRGKYGITITQSYVKPFYNISDRVIPKKLKKPQQAISSHTDKTKGTPKVRRLFNILKFGKVKDKRKEVEKVQVKLSKNTTIQNYVEVETPQTIINTVHDVIRPAISPKKYNSGFCKPVKRDFRINKKEKKLQKIISNIVCKSRANTSLTSPSARTRNITSNLSNKSELHIPINKHASSARKFFNSLHFTHDKHFKKQDIRNETSDVNIPKNVSTESYNKSLDTLTRLSIKKQGRSKSFYPKIKRCLNTLKLHKKGKYNKKSCEVNTETQSVIMSDDILPDFLERNVSTKSKYSKASSYLSNHSKPLILLCMPRKCNRCTENKYNSSKISRFHSSNTKTLSNSIGTRKLRVDNRSTKLLYANKALCKRIRYSRKQAELTRFSKKSFMPSVNSHKYMILSENNSNREPRINKNNLNFIKNKQRRQKMSDSFSYNKDISLCSHMTSSSNKHVCTYKIMKNDEQCCSKLLSRRTPTQVYTTNTVTFGQTRLKTPDILLKNSYCDATKETLRFKSKFNRKINHMNKRLSRNCMSELPGNFPNQSESTMENQVSWITRKEFINPAQLTGVVPRLRRCYCAMNVQVSGRNVRRKHHYNSQRLNSIPYQYQKCIMDRFVRTPTMSGTERRLKTSPNSTPSVSSGSRTRSHVLRVNHIVQQHAAYMRPMVGFKYQSIPRYIQEVPVGFTIGINNDFSERESETPHSSEVFTVPKCQSTSRSSKTYDRYVRSSAREDYDIGRGHRQSRSMMSQMFHTASTVRPMLRQCFWSLKLHKKGRLQKAREMESMNEDKAKYTEDIADKPVPKNKQNMKKHHYPDLVQYESVIQGPDEPDPTWSENKKKLELRERRYKQSKNFESDSITSHYSFSSNIPSSEIREKQMQFHKYGGHPIPDRSRDAYPSDIIIEDSAFQLPRQPYRIQSRYSFDKEKPYYFNEIEPRNFRRYAYTHGKMRKKWSRDGRQKRDSDSQIVLIKHGQSRTFLKRCFGALKFLTTSRKYHRKPNNVGRERTLPPLVPPVVAYNCEPDVYVPSYGNTYKGGKLVHTRRAKDTIRGPTRARTKPASSFTLIRTSKSNMAPYKSTRRPKRYRRREDFSNEIIIDELSHHPHVQIAAIQHSRPRRYKGHGHCKKKHRDRRSRQTVSFRNRESQIEVPKIRNKVLWPKLRRCFCKLKFCRQKSMSDKCTMFPYEEVSILNNNRSNIAPSNLWALSSESEHYERKPVVCVPGKSGPYKCESRIKGPDMSSSVTLTEGYSSKSKSITEHSLRRSEAQSVMQSKPRKTRKYQYEVRKTQYITNMVQTPLKRTSHIFRIDFLKDKPPDGGVINSRQIKQPIAHKKSRRVPNKLTNNRVSYKNSEEQHERTLHDQDSQVLPRKIHSKMTGVGPFLKKCFCTLQLHKSPNRFSFAMKAPQTVTKPKLEAFSTESAAYTRRPYQFHSRQLGPYECEPGDYVPGLCDSYRCKKRKMVSKYSNTDPLRMRSKSSSIQVKTKCKKTQSGFRSPTQRNVRTYHRGDGHSRYKNEYLREEPFLYGSEAIQVRSSFNSNVEFNKNGSPQISSACNINKNNKREMKGTGTTSTEPRSISSSSKRSYVQDCKPQSDYVKTESIASRASLLQKCFSTLKRKGKQQHAKTAITPPTNSLGTDPKKQIIVSGTRIRTKTKQKYPQDILEPYECGLGVCVPGNCDPYDCRKRKKLKNMRHPGIGSPRITKSMSSVTSKDVDTKAMNTYLYKQKHDKRRTASTETIYRNRQPQQIFHVNNHRCQLGSWKSRCRMNMDVMKDPRFGKTYKSEKPISHVKYKSKGIQNPDKIISKGSEAQDLLQDVWSQASVKKESRGSTMIPILKRCFCTLTTLQRLEFKNRLRLAKTNKDEEKVLKTNKDDRKIPKTSKDEGKVQKNNKEEGKVHKTSKDEGKVHKTSKDEGKVHKTSKDEGKVHKTSKDEGKVQTTDQRTSTKKRHSSKAVPLPPQPPNHKIMRIENYEPIECQPGVCVPGQCDPSQCLERNKRGGIRRISRRRRASQVSVSSKNAQFVPRYKCVKTQHEQYCVPYKIDTIVEEPRFPFFHNNLLHPMRQGVKISSNFRFNIEFYKETLPYTIKEEAVKEKPICYKDACIECKNPNKLSRNSYSCTRKYCRDRECQSQTPATKDKSFTVSIFKRCFCTAKFQRPHVSQSTRPQPITVHRVEEIRPKILFGPREYQVQYQINQPTKKSVKMTPPQSKTIMSGKNSKHGKNNNLCYPADEEKHKLTFRKMFHRCNNLFNKQSNEKYIDNLNKQKDNYLVKPNHELPLVDILKSSKSERHSNKATKECIKKSKSLKVAKMDGKINIIKKYSRFQSGDAAGKFEKDSHIIIDSRQVCPNYQVPLVNTVAVKKKVRFASVCSNITNCLIPKNQKKESKPVFFLFENKHFKKNNGKLCSCCGRVKRKTRKAVTFNNSVVLTSKISKPVKQTMALQEIRKRHKLPCPRCFCRKHKSVMDRSMLRVYGKKDGSSVFGHPICYKEAETRFPMIHLEANKNKCNYETTICPAKTKKKAPALEYIYIRPQRKNDKNKKLTEVKNCDKIYKGKKIKKLCKTNKKHVTNRMKKCKDTLGSLLVTKPILGLHKLGVPNVKAVLPLHRVVFIPRYIYHNFQPYLRGPVRVSKNLIKRTKDGPVAAILKRFKLRLHAVKFIFSPVKVDIVIVTTQSQVEI